MPMKPSLSARQVYYLQGLAGGYDAMTFAEFGPGRSYNPLTREQRTFDALERRGLVRWKRRELEGGHNGYVITDAGRAALMRAQ